MLPYAFTASVTVLLMPYLLRRNGATVEQMAAIVTVASLPTISAFLWSPIADAGLQRRFWIVLAALGAGLTAGGSILSVRKSHAALTALLFAMNAFGGLLSSACGALLSGMPVEVRSQAAGWYQGGNTGGAAVGGALLIWLADRAGLGTLAVVSLAAMIVPTIAALRVREQPSPGHGDGFFRDIRAIFLSSRAWIGLLFLLSPVGSAAAGHLISGMGQDYQASGTVVAWVTGIGGGLFSAAGSLIGGAVAGRMGRLVAYPFAGALACLFGLYLGFGGATPLTYALGYSGYSLAAGFAFAVYTAMVLDIVGGPRSAAASGYAVLNSAGNLPIAYMTWLDGLAYRTGGVRGTMSLDAAANGVFSVLLLAIAILMRRRWETALRETA